MNLGHVSLSRFSHSVPQDQGAERREGQDDPKNKTTDCQTIDASSLMCLSLRRLADVMFVLSGRPVDGDNSSHELLLTLSGFFFLISFTKEKNPKESEKLLWKSALER